MYPKYNAKDLERFWAKTDKSNGEDACWVWIAGRTTRGYGTIYWLGTSHLSSRIAYEITYGAIPDGQCVLHKCDNPPCVNPKHLFLGTRQDNLADMRTKGREKHAVGTENGAYTCPEKVRRGTAITLSKLDDDKVRDIRNQYDKGDTSYDKLAKQYSVSKQVIASVIHRKTWRHVDAE